MVTMVNMVTGRISMKFGMATYKQRCHVSIGKYEWREEARRVEDITS